MTQFIEVYENALTNELCDKIISRHQSSNQVTKGRVGSGVDIKLKDSHDVSMIHREGWQELQQEIIQSSYPHLRAYLEKHYLAVIAALNPTVTHPKTGEPTKVTKDNFHEVGLPYLDQLIQYVFRYDGFTVQKYDKGQGGYHYWHSEIYPQLPDNKPLHRVLAFLYYLNDVEEGGETEFHYQQIKAKPKKGNLIIFPAGFTHTHKGHIPISNDKYVVTSWLMFNRAEHLYGQAK
ncbi:2OG-Fe(II) oxygenase [Litorilituus sediminis]|uniref:2OG-Fe(II) oxygenase n=1 Tax=Litorilituus sediminis TaxID=718192 RepID=A0A4P6PDQ2_9GAMM|nr:2OG-Fe(II) oxygenase [Litorilituus sediminis]QBG37867.1 2OG-Fe(II) oxygenase [Litorilituus sediminis]